MDLRTLQPVAGNTDSWLRNFWNESSRRAKVFYVGSVVALFSFISYWTLRVLIGWYFLVVYYISTARGTGSVSLTCHRVGLETKPFRTLSNKDWFLLQRCKGAEWGLNRHGASIPSPREVVAHFTVNSRFSPILVSLRHSLSEVHTDTVSLSLSSLSSRFGLCPGLEER